MHEMSIAQGMIDIIRDEMRRHNARVLRTVRVRIGTFSSVVPDALSFCFNIITKDTDMEGASLIIETIPLRGSCSACNSEFEIKDYLFLCPVCGGIRIDTVSGQELTVAEIEVD